MIWPTNGCQILQQEYMPWQGDVSIDKNMVLEDRVADPQRVKSKGRSKNNSRVEENVKARKRVVAIEVVGGMVTTCEIVLVKIYLGRRGEDRIEMVQRILPYR